MIICINFVDTNQISENNICILGKDVKHIKDVLRLRLNDKIEISVEGINYICEIQEILKDKIITSILSKTLGENEPPIDIILYQGLTKGNKMDLIIQKVQK